MKIFVAIVILCLSIHINAFSQAQSYTDPAQAYNRLVIEKNNGSYIRMSRYKVIGTPYLYGGKRRGNVYAKGESAKGIIFSYNLYSKELEVYVDGSDKLVTKGWASLDSFSLDKVQQDVTYPSDIHFISSALLGSKDKTFFQVVATGEKYTLYKKYTGILSVVSTSFVDADLREFDINYEYHYRQSGKEGSLKKLKANKTALVKEFPEKRPCVESMPTVELFTNIETYLITFFSKLEACTL